jgi:NTP pyrophosphatase (non-canonical NTP hydrolase)
MICTVHGCDEFFCRQNHDPDSPDYDMPSLQFSRLREQNVARLERWHGASAAWTGADRGNSMAGEGGEAMEAAFAIIQFGIRVGIVANTIKKIRRHETGLGTSYNTPELLELKARLGEEAADVVIYADLLTHHYDIDLGLAVIDKFNKVSIGNGFPERL